MTYTPVVIDRRAIPEDTLPSLTVARQHQRAVRRELGLSNRTVPLLTDPTHQPKTGRNDLYTLVMHLTPADGSDIINVCPAATVGCRAACLNTAGRGRFDTVQSGRLARTRLLAKHPESFMALLVSEITNAVNRQHRIAVRLNGTSDIRWETFAPWLLERWPTHQVVWYDYTKHPRRNPPSNYTLTYSVSERDTPTTIQRAMQRYGRIAVVVDTPSTDKHTPLPETWNGWPTVDGDQHDLRLEPNDTVILLRAKGNAIHDQTGFIQPTHC